MANKSKKLVFIDDKKEVIKQKDDVFYEDSEDGYKRYSANRDFGYYIMTNLYDTEIKRKVNPRIYLYKWGYNQRMIGYFPLSQTDDRNRFKYFITDNRYRHYGFVQKFFKVHFPERKSYAYTVSIINGLRLFLNFLDKTNKNHINLEDINTRTVNELYEYYNQESQLTKVNWRCIKEFFTLLSSKQKIKTPPLKKSKSNKKKAIPSSVVYQLNYHATDSIKRIIKVLGNMVKDPMCGSYATKNHSMLWGKSYEKIISISCFNGHILYPFVLYFLINYGLNLETLKSWKVFKDNEGNYKLDADYLKPFVLINGIKNRSNSEVTTVVQSNSLGKIIIDFLLKHLKPLYDCSDNKEFFQYYYCIGGVGIKQICSSYFTNINNSPHEYSFYNQYEIFDLDGNRIKRLNHTYLRKSHTYQDFFKGKKEFERQIRKTHKSGSTTKIHYENQNFEWQEAKKHKIALAQNLVVGIFKGEITREEHKTVKLFEVGPMADCKDNKHPTFDNATDMKDNEYCIDWTKCLTRCNKSYVIPKIHGPVIFAWIKHMQDLKSEFIREVDWEKEYLVDYQAAKNTISFFTEEENEFCLKERYKHMSFIKMKFTRTSKIKGSQYA